MTPVSRSTDTLSAPWDRRLGLAAEAFGADGFNGTSRITQAWSVPERPHGRRLTSLPFAQSASVAAYGEGAGASALARWAVRTNSSPQSSMRKRLLPSKILVFRPDPLIECSRHCEWDISRIRLRFVA